MPVMAWTIRTSTSRPGDYQSRPRWSAGKKMEAVLRLLRGESLEELSRELQVEAHRLAAWRDDFLENGKEGLKEKMMTTAGEAENLTRRWVQCGALTAVGAVLIVLAFWLPSLAKHLFHEDWSTDTLSRVSDALVGLIGIVIPVAIGGDAHIRHAHISKGHKL